MVSHALVTRAQSQQARLPVSYENARTALAECDRVDECKTWADKAAAIASYAKQADDEELLKTATRIKGRAIKRMGELLKQMNGHAGRPKNGVDTHPNSRRSIAQEAGVSPHQARQAVRVANVPDKDFEAAIEQDHPPTVTELARRGTNPSTAHLHGRNPREFNAALHTRARLRDMAAQCEKVAPAVAIRGSIERDWPKMRTWAKAVNRWTKQVLDELDR